MELPRVARVRLYALLAALVVLCAPAPPARAAATAADPNAPVLDADPIRPPPGFRLNATQARKIAARAPAIVAELHRHPQLRPYVYTKGAGRWQVSWFAPGTHGRELAEVYVADATGKVTEVWTGFQVAWTMARGYSGAFGRHLNAWYIWLALCLLFAAAFIPRRRRDLGLLQLDAAVLLSFSVSLAFFNHARIGLSVPLAYPGLLYLLVRMLLLAAGRGRPRVPFRPLVPTAGLAIGLVFLIGFRVALNVSDGNVIDVGYAGVIGADKLIHGQRLYGGWPKDNRSGDTYGPVNYEAYVPFRGAFGWSGTWDDLPAAHAAAVAFDLFTLVGLFFLGRLIRGPDLGILFAYAWAAFPFTLYALESGANDSLVALLVVVALLAMRWAPARGAAGVLAGLTKFAPLALAPLLLRGLEDRLRWRSAAGFAGGFGLVALVAMLPVVLHGNLSAFWHDSIAYQFSRGSPFSVWGLWGGLGFEQRFVQGLALGLALIAVVVPRRRGLVEVSAMGAAILIALQLGVTHWFYLYIPWFFPLVLVAGVLAGSPAQGGACPSAAAAAAGSGPAPA